MAYLVLARKYRPQTFEEVVRQEHVTRTLTNAIAAERVAHAILFSGPRGTGKTTIARILAKAMNCRQGPTATPCNQCPSCREITAGGAADVYEIDGASNNSVDQVRELRENLRYMPARSRFKIYIIDEVHMLSIAAFNALLKTLEEPPAHVLFFFATTEPHKIPVTILSRCQRHDLKRVELEALTAHMQSLCEREGLDIDDPSLILLAREADGSVRDSLSLLDQIMGAAEGKVRVPQVLELLGIVDRSRLFALSEALLARNSAQVLTLVDEVYRAGQDLKKLYDDLLEQFRNLILAKGGAGSLKLVDLPAHEIEQLKAQAENVSEVHLVQLFEQLFQHEESLRFAAQPKLALECIFLQLLQIPPALPVDTLIAGLDKLKETWLTAAPGLQTEGHAAPAPAPEPGQSPPSEPSQSPPLKSEIPASKGSVASARGGVDVSPQERWRRVQTEVAQSHPALAANLKHCRLGSTDSREVVIVAGGSEFSVKQIEKERNRQILEDVIRNQFGAQAALRIDARPENHRADLEVRRERLDKLRQEALSNPLVADVVEIFNGQIIDIKLPKES
jgi:DNA polymerase-3 subunit gamma/tau